MDMTHNVTIDSPTCGVPDFDGWPNATPDRTTALSPSSSSLGLQVALSSRAGMLA
jgi:hypothetical protein